jgi:DNA-binding transcriptional MerR regulator/effector-binding domain-containing protein
MDEPEDQLLRIGVFSTLSRISVRMLRHYQDRGLLAPAWVDPVTGYRFYAAGQLADAQMITVMRDAGMGLAPMSELLAGRADPATVRRLVAEHRARLESDRAAIAARSAALDLIEPAIARTLREDTTVTADVRLQTLPAMTVASLRGMLPSYADEGQLWERLMPLAARSGARFPAAPVSGATFHDPDYRDSDADVEIWMEVERPFSPVPPLACEEWPEREVVMATLHGSYDGISEVMEALGAHIAEHRLETGPMFNIYRVGPATDPDPAHWVTDVCVPVVRR